MKRVEIKALVDETVTGIEHLSESDAMSVRSYEALIEKRGNLLRKHVDHLLRIKDRLERRKAGIPAPKPTN